MRANDPGTLSISHPDCPGAEVQKAAFDQESPPLSATIPAKNVFRRTVDDRTELRLIDLQHGNELWEVFDHNRPYLRRWHPWVDHLNSPAAVQTAIASWQQLYAERRACHAGIWFRGRLCGMVSYLSVDRINRSTPICFWLDEAHQGKGIATASCRSMVTYGFAAWGFHRITIECATENTRSRAVAERLGFKLEGILRGIQWLHVRFVDAALYALLRCDYETSLSRHASPRPNWARSS